MKNKRKKEKHDRVGQKRGNRGDNEMRQILDVRIEPLKKTESVIVQLNLRNNKDNKELDIVVSTTLLIIESLGAGKTEHMQRQETRQAKN